MLKIAWKDVIRSKNSLIIIVCLSFTLIVPIVMYSISASLMQATAEENEKVFGSFDNVLYFADNKNFLKQVESNISSVGTLAVYQIDHVGEDITLGYADRIAIDLAKVHILSGNWPNKENDVLVCNSLVRKSDLNLNVGSIMSINGQNYTISGIINDYYSLWNKVDNRELCFPNVLIGELGIDPEMKTLQKHLLIKNRIPFSPNIYLTWDTLVLNTNRIENDTSEKYALPLFVLVLTSCCVGMLNIYVFSYYIEKEKGKLAILRCLGLTETESYFYYLAKMNVLLLIAAPCGLFMGYTIAKVLITVFNVTLASHISLYCSHRYIVNSVLICFTTTYFSFLTAVYKLHKMSPLDQLTSNGQRTIKTYTCNSKFRKIDFARLVSIEIQTHINQSTVALLMISFSITLVILLSLYMDIFSLRVKDVPGRMPVTFDYEFLSEEKTSQNCYVDASGIIQSLDSISVDSSMVYIPDHNNLFPISVLNELANNSDVYEVRSYQEVNDLYLINSPAEKDNIYLSGYPLDGEIPEILKRTFNINSTTRGIQYCGFSEEEILRMAPFIVAGEINIEKIRNGEEVILIAPMYELNELGDGYIKQSFLSSDEFQGKDNQYRDCYYSVGDMINFVQITPFDKTYSGYIHYSQIEKNLTYNRKSVKIGAIIYERIAWFDRMAQMPTAYTLIGLNESIVNLSLLPTSSRVQIYLNSNVSYLDFDPLIHNYADIVKNFSLRNNAAEMANYKKLQLLISSVSFGLQMISVVTVIGIMLVEEWVKFHQNRRYYNLLRINGLTNEGLLVVLISRSALESMLGLVGSIIACSMLIPVMFGDISDTMIFLNPFSLVIAILGFLMTLTCTPVFVTCFEKTSAIKILRNY